jgi:hypothetical protein
VPFRGVFRVDEPVGQRWELALDRLRTGERIVIADVALNLSPAGVTVTAVSAWTDPQRITSEAALADIRRAELVLSDLSDSSHELAELFAGRDIEIDVVVDYETGSILVATSRHGETAWADGRPLMP